jgi:hypothetical protein
MIATRPASASRASGEIGAASTMGRSMQERWFDVVGDGGVRLRAREVAGPSTGAPGLSCTTGSPRRSGSGI